MKLSHVDETVDFKWALTRREKARVIKDTRQRRKL